MGQLHHYYNVEKPVTMYTRIVLAKIHTKISIQPFLCPLNRTRSSPTLIFELKF